MKNGMNELALGQISFEERVKILEDTLAKMPEEEQKVLNELADKLVSEIKKSYVVIKAVPFSRMNALEAVKSGKLELNDYRQPLERNPRYECELVWEGK